MAPAPLTGTTGPFEPLARTLSPWAWPGERVRIDFLAAELDPPARDGLAALTRPRTPPRSGSSVYLEADADVLRQLADRHPAAGVLLEAHHLANRPIAPPRLMGILNVTPDSFSDGGRHADLEAAVLHGLKLIAAGAEILDVGGESTRPGSQPVSVEEECARVLPVIEALAREGGATISIDTTKSRVARAALEAGARVVNDVSGALADPDMLQVVVETGADLILMHMQGTPRTMQIVPRYQDVVGEVFGFLRERVSAAWNAGVELSRISVDPGFGFGKSVEDNLRLLRSLPQLRSLGLPILVGVSRKSFLGHLGGEDVPSLRDVETQAAVTLGAFLGADVHRVHEVAPHVRCLRIAHALAQAPSGLS